MLSNPVIDIDIGNISTPDDLVKAFSSAGGFTASHVSTGVDILENMIKDRKCKVFLSFPACIISTGTRGVIKELVKRKLVDYIITTCGTLDHDIARSFKKYYSGSFNMDDAKLYDEGINRLGNVLVPNESYGTIIEDFLTPVLEDIYKEHKRISTRDLSWEIGKRINDESSILYWAYKNQIPVFIPGPTDGSVGSQLWMLQQKHSDFVIDILKDETYLSDIVFTEEVTGALMIGGGISKHHTIWWNQFKDGLDYAVYITTAQEYDGSLSGAKIKEAISWGKVKKDARYITIDGDATVILPLMASSLLGRL